MLDNHLNRNPLDNRSNKLNHRLNNKKLLLKVMQKLEKWLHVEFEFIKMIKLKKFDIFFFNNLNKNIKVLIIKIILKVILFLFVFLNNILTINIHQKYFNQFSFLFQFPFIVQQYFIFLLFLPKPL